MKQQFPVNGRCLTPFPAMNRTILLGAVLLFAQPGWAQLYNATPNQTQSLNDATSIELGDGFSSSSEINITIASPLNTVGQWATVANWGTFIGIHTSVLPNGNVLSWQGHNDTPEHGDAHGHRCLFMESYEANTNHS